MYGWNFTSLFLNYPDNSILNDFIRGEYDKKKSGNSFDDLLFKESSFLSYCRR